VTQESSLKAHRNKRPSAKSPRETARSEENQKNLRPQVGSDLTAPSPAQHRSGFSKMRQVLTAAGTFMFDSGADFEAKPRGSTFTGKTVHDFRRAERCTQCRSRKSNYDTKPVARWLNVSKRQDSCRRMDKAVDWSHSVMTVVPKAKLQVTATRHPGRGGWRFFFSGPGRSSR